MEDQISEADAAAISAAMAEETAPSAKSLKCADCGKLFKNADLANYHAEKSGHENFEESVDEVPLALEIGLTDRSNLLRRKRRKRNWKS
jgi:hypothetical protein